MNITEWVKESGEVAKSKGFVTKAEDIHRSLLMIVGEIAEAQNELRSGKHTHEVYFPAEKPEGFGIELADAVLRIFNLAHDLNLDLETMVKMKHNYNKTRAFKHGGKQF